MRITDHLGNNFESISEAARAYGRKTRTVHTRLRKGWSLKDALTTPEYGSLSKKAPAIDHMGNRFSTGAEMCKHYGVDWALFRIRIKRCGWSLERALTPPTRRKSGHPCTDYLGNAYTSISEAARAYGIDPQLAHSRMNKNGWSFEQALTTLSGYGKVVTDHLGNEFPSLMAMCKHYGISSVTFCTRRSKNGWSLERTLTTPIDTTKKPHSHNNPVVDHLGNEFSSATAMCKHYGITWKVFHHRFHDYGWSLEKSLTEPLAPNHRTCEDHLGNVYKGHGAMCRHYNVSQGTFESRISRGWSLEDALTRPSGAPSS